VTGRQANEGAEVTCCMG